MAVANQTFSEMLREWRLVLEETSALIHQSRVTELADANPPMVLASIISSASGAGRWNDEVGKAQEEIKHIRVGLGEIQENIILLENSIADDNARLQALQRAEQIKEDISGISTLLRRSQLEKLSSIRDRLSGGLENLESEESKLKEEEHLLEEKKDCLKKLKESSEKLSNHFDSEKLHLLEKIAMKEEEISINEKRLDVEKEEFKKLLHCEHILQSFETEVTFMSLKLDEKIGLKNRLEIRAKNHSRGTSTRFPVQSYIEELKDTIHSAEERMCELQIQQEAASKSLEISHREIQLRETILSGAKEELTQIMPNLNGSSLDLRDISRLESEYQRCLEIKKSRENLQIQLQVMNAQLGQLNRGEAALPAWPLHACFKFKQDIPGNFNYLTAMNVIAGSLKKVCVTETTAAAAELLQMWERRDQPTRFFRIWPLDRLKAEERLDYHRVVQKAYPKGSVILPLDLLLYDSKFDKAMKRAFGGYVISSNDDVGRDLILHKMTPNVTIDGKVNQIGSITGGWRNIDNSFLHIKFRKDKADTELRSLIEVEKEMKDLETSFHEVEACEVRKKLILQDITLVEKEISNFRKEAKRHQMLLDEYHRLASFLTEDIKISKKRLEDAMKSDLIDENGINAFMKAIEEAKSDESAIHDILNNLHFQQQKMEAEKKTLTEKLQNLNADKLQHTISTCRTDLADLKKKLLQVETAMDLAQKEDEKQAEMIAALSEDVESTNKIILEIQDEIFRIRKNIKQLKVQKAKVEEELKNLPQPQDWRNEEVENEHILKDEHQYVILKQNLKKMIAEVKQINLQEKQISLDERFAINEKMTKLHLFKERKASIIDSIDILVEGIQKTKDKVQKANEEIFQKTRESFIECCKFLVPNKHVDLIKIGQHVEDGVQFSFCNVTHGSAGSSKEWKANLSELSGGQRTLISLAFVLMVAQIGQSSLYLMDEVDAALDEHNQKRIATLIHSLASRGSQVICISHHLSFQEHSDIVIQVSRAEGSTRIQQTHTIS